MSEQPKSNPTQVQPDGSVVLPPLKDMWEIVVAGNIDPRQHNPYWYQLIGCISEEELKNAIGNFQATPSHFVFDAGPFAITALTNRWTISTVFEGNRERMIDVTSVVFKKLNEISVIAYGINRTLIVRSSIKSPLKLLAKKLVEAGLFFPNGESICTIDFRDMGNGFETFVRLAPSIFSNDELVIVYNRQHNIGPQVGYYDIGPMVKDSADPGWMAADAYGATIRQQILG